jgi:hypothetical protein
VLLLPDVGRNFLARYFLRREIVDRDADLQIGLFTNVVADNATTFAALVEPQGIGYARQSLNDLDWTVSPTGAGSHPKVSFTAGEGGWNGIIQGYFICSRAVGGTPRLVGLEFDTQQTLFNPLLRTGSVVTCVTPAAHRLSDAGLINIRGANQAEYNGIFAATVTTPSSFTYLVSGSPASPSGGLITVNRCFQMGVGATYSVTPIIYFGA